MLNVLNYFCCFALVVINGFAVEDFLENPTPEEAKMLTICVGCFALLLASFIKGKPTK